MSDVEIPDDGQSHHVEMQERGRFTSQLVKFSHHVSGRAHFSLSGKVRSEIGRDSFPLNGPIGRIFELTIIYPERFKPLDRLKRDRLYANFTDQSHFPDALQIRGEWRRRVEILKNATDKRASVGPATFTMHRRIGEIAPTVFLAPPVESRLREHLLLVSCHPTPLPGGATKAGVVFMGAFDRRDVADPNERIHRGNFLAAMFPTESTQEIRAAVGSIDLG